jgi:pyruvate kinase
VGRRVAIMMDIKGPEIRTGDLPQPLQLSRGDELDLYISREELEKRVDKVVPAITVNYPGFVRDVNVGDTVLVDSGLIRMTVVAKGPYHVRCSVRTPGPLGNRRHINLPGVNVNLPALTEKDARDLRLGIEEGCEFFALSFVRSAEDLDILRRHIAQEGSRARIIAKIEDQSGVRNLEEIIRACDGLMVARGDLGIEVPYEDLPLLQRRAVQICREMGKPVIIATHMLESMISSPMPTRAEITDVAHAVFEQADCVMLSGETSVGKYPMECLEVLNRIISKIELDEGPLYNDALPLRTPKTKMLRSAVILAAELEGAAILVFTRHGALAQILSSLRPRKSPVYAFTDVRLSYMQMLPLWGVEPFHLEFSDNPEETIQRAFDILKAGGWSKPGDTLVVLTNVLASERVVDSIQIRVVE